MTDPSVASSDAPVPRVVVRADGGAGLGIGHLGRCLALVERFVAWGSAVTLEAEQAPGEWVARYRAAGAGVDLIGSDSGSEEGIPASDPPDLAVIDGYGFGPDVQRRYRSGGKVLVIDDFGRVPSHDADVVLDQNMGAPASLYFDASTSGARVLLGPRYALLRNEVRRHAGSWSPGQGPQRVGLLPGGSSNRHVADCFDAVEAALLGDGIEVERVSGRPGLGAAVAPFRAVLAAAGTTTWELAAVGVPSVLVAIADNQRPIARAMGRIGAAIDGGDLHRVDPSVLARHLLALCHNADRSVALSDRARQLVDGRGASRVATALRATTVVLRQAVDADETWTFDLANDPVVRAASLSSAAIARDEHAAWFRSRLADAASLLLVVEGSGKRGAPLGVVRFEPAGRDGTWKIGVSLRQSARGGGFGSAVISAGCQWLLRAHPGARVEAVIRAENQASSGAFTAADFEPVPEGTDHGPAQVTFEYGGTGG